MPRVTLADGLVRDTHSIPGAIEADRPPANARGRLGQQVWRPSDRRVLQPRPAGARLERLHPTPIGRVDNPGRYT